MRSINRFQIILAIATLTATLFASTSIAREASEKISVQCDVATSFIAHLDIAKDLQVVAVTTEAISVANQLIESTTPSFERVSIALSTPHSRWPQSLQRGPPEIPLLFPVSAKF